MGFGIWSWISAVLTTVPGDGGPPCHNLPVRTIRVTRYVTPLREGGSLPAIVEADDDGMYVLKFRGAGQGTRALIAELVSGEIARALGLPVPELVFAELEADLARTEPDPEIHALIQDSAGLNLALDYLPGLGHLRSGGPQARIRSSPSRIVWFDAYVTNVDRTARNTNMLMWHRRLWLIDHGATLYFHHAPGWESGGQPRPRSVPADREARAAAARAGMLGGRRRRDGRGARRRRSSRRSSRWIPETLAAATRPVDAASRARRVRALPARAAGGAARVRRGGRACPLSHTPTTTRSSASCRASSAASRSTSA